MESLRSPEPSSPCSLRLYVYRQYLPLTEAILALGKRVFAVPDARPSSSASCLEHACQYSSFSHATPRVFTGDVPVYQRLMACPRVTKASSADFFLFPVPLGSWMVLSWEKRDVHGGLGREAHDLTKRLVAETSKFKLPHLRRSTAPRHLFLFSK